MALIELDVAPMGKPRMTQRDRWKKRPVVLRYRDYCDELRLKWDARLEREVLLDPYLLVFFIPVPKSWSKKRKEAMIGTPHMAKPDKDNLEKAVLDALLPEDSHVWSGWVKKQWSETPAIAYAPLQGWEEYLGSVLTQPARPSLAGCGST